MLLPKEYMEYKEKTMHKIYRKMLLGTVTISLLLGNWRGRVALFMRGKDIPLALYPVRLELLPIADQTQLMEGIPISDPEVLTDILEDLLS